MSPNRAGLPVDPTVSPAASPADAPCHVLLSPPKLGHVPLHVTDPALPPGTVLPPALRMRWLPVLGSLWLLVVPPASSIFQRPTGSPGRHRGTGGAQGAAARGGCWQRGVVLGLSSQGRVSGGWQEGDKEPGWVLGMGLEVLTRVEMSREVLSGPW